MIAAPLSHGSNPNSNAAGRRREDDENLVIAGPLGGGNDGIGRRFEDDPHLVAYALRKDPGGTGQGHNTNYIVAGRTEIPANRASGHPGSERAYPISGDALRGEGTAKTPSADAEGRVRLRDPGFAVGEDGDPAFTLSAVSPGAVATASVRRLTPVECERLQALPDGWTDLGDTADSKRYSALGDAVTASVAEWIGSRIIRAAEREDTPAREGAGS